jgi:outer membrane autotransporter protein
MSARVSGGAHAACVHQARWTRLMAGTMLAGGLALSTVALGLASAADGDGGNGGGTGFGTGGAGATGSTGLKGGGGNAGQARTFGGGGGGGGGGAGGGMGGTGGNSGDGASGGTGGGAGLPGNSGTGGCDCDFISGGGGGGGGGGTNGTTAASINNSTLLTGMAGGAGGTGGAGAFGGNGGGGGGGGAGGFGAVMTGAAVNTNTNAITGGNGGNGGNGGAGGGSFEGGGTGGSGGNGGNGGTGGTGIAFTTPGASLTTSGTIRGGDGGAGGMGGNGAPANATGGTGGNGGAGGAGGAGITASGLTLTNSGLILGGNGGIGGSAGVGLVSGTVGAGGLGGVGVSGGGLTIINTGTISGGFPGGSGAQANSLSLTSGSNFLNNQGGILNGGINVAALATLTFNQSGPVTVPNVISGGGAIIQDGAGALVLTGTNTYTGGTTISSATLQLGNGGATGTIDGKAGVINNSNLAFDHSNSFTFANTVTGSGAVQQIGTGTTILTGNSTYTGATTVAAGGLTINGSLGTAGSHTSLLTNSGTVTVNGTLWATNVANNAGGVIINSGTVNGALNNSGTVTNNGSFNAAVNNTGSQALITNFTTWTGSLVSNAAGATVNNFGTWTGDANNTSVVVNSGTWNTASAGFVNSGTLTTTGTLNNAKSGGLTNTGTVNAQGTISGAIANIGPGTFTVTGPLSGSGGNFSNGSGATLMVGANTFNNIGVLTNNTGGTINIAGGTVGAVTTTNAGTINAVGSSTISGSLTNAGTISLQNNFAGDRLAVTGNFVGSPGGRILLDFNPQTARADQVVIGGSATGSTPLFVNNLAPGTLFTTSPNLIVTQGPTSPNAFTLGNTQNFGTFSVALLPTASGAGLNFALGTIPSSAGLSGSVAMTAAQTLGFVSNDVAFDRLSELRNSLRRNSSQSDGAPATAYAQESAKNDPVSPYLKAEAAPSSSSGPNPAAWVRGFGDFEQRDGQASFGFGGSAFTSSLGFHQGTGGVLGGVDFVWNGLTRANDGLILGLLGGYTNSRVELRDSPTSQVFSGESIGAYGTYLTGNWFFDMLLKVDLLSLDINIPGIFQSASLNNYNAATNIGYKFDLPNYLYIEPTAGLEYIRTNFDQSTSLTATTVALNDGYALRARAGARVGTEWVVNNIRVEPSVLATVWEIPAATSTALFTNGVGISLPSDVGRVRGEVQAAVNFFNLQTGLSGFTRFDTRFGEGLFSLGGLAGLRYQW